MSDCLDGDLFAEDRAHEEFLRALCMRLFEECGAPAVLHVRSARGGHGRAYQELGLYQRSVLSRPLPIPDLLIVCIDSNCSRYAEARRKVESALLDEFRDRAVVACPDPYIERWYMADPVSFFGVVGSRPQPGRRKCEPGKYKAVLAQAVQKGGHPSTLQGIEFARELAQGMDFYRASQNEPSLGHFISDLRARLRRAKGEN